MSSFILFECHDRYRYRETPQTLRRKLFGRYFVHGILKRCVAQPYLQLNLWEKRGFFLPVLWAFIMFISLCCIQPDLFWVSLLIVCCSPAPSQAHTLMSFTLPLSLNLVLRIPIMSQQSCMTLYRVDADRNSWARGKVRAVLLPQSTEGTSQNCSIFKSLLLTWSNIKTIWMQNVQGM